MQTIEAGETRKVSICGELRTVEVVGKGSIPGWWECTDLETGLRFMASEQWFVGRTQVARR